MKETENEIRGKKGRIGNRSANLSVDNEPISGCIRYWAITLNENKYKVLSIEVELNHESLLVRDQNGLFKFSNGDRCSFCTEFVVTLESKKHFILTNSEIDMSVGEDGIVISNGDLI